MAVRISTRLRNFIIDALKMGLQGGVLEIWSGSQPASGDAAATGTLLATLTLASGARTNEVLSRGKVTLTGGAAGSVDAITVNSVSILPAAVAFNTTLAQTAIDVATAINSNVTFPNYKAIASGTDIIIEAMPLTGTAPNGYVVASTVTTITKTDVNMGTTATGVAQVNGLTFGAPGSGALAPSGTWSGVGVANGVAGWGRFKGTIVDDNSLDSTNQYFIRMDGAVGTTGSDINLVNTTVSIGGTVQVTGGNFTQPAA